MAAARSRVRYGDTNYSRSISDIWRVSPLRAGRRSLQSHTRGNLLRRRPARDRSWSARRVPANCNLRCAFVPARISVVLPYRVHAQGVLARNQTRWRFGLWSEFAFRSLTAGPGLGQRRQKRMVAHDVTVYERSREQELSPHSHSAYRRKKGLYQTCKALEAG